MLIQKGDARVTRTASQKKNKTTPRLKKEQTLTSLFGLGKITIPPAALEKCIHTPHTRGDDCSLSWLIFHILNSVSSRR